MHIAPGGFGKTYKKLTDNGLVNVVYTTLTNNLVDEQKKSITKPKCYTKDKLISKLCQGFKC
jgi:hypothetical protein